MTDAPDWEGFGRDLMQGWPVRDVDGCELFEAALRNGLLLQVTGGYDPEQHIDAEGICPETGDPWYEYAFPHTPATMRCAECDCERGGADCNWIATPTPLDDPRVKALVEAATELHDKAMEKHQRHRSDIWPVIRKLRAALSALEENK